MTDNHGNICETCTRPGRFLWGVFQRCYRNSRRRSILATLAFRFYRAIGTLRTVDTFITLTPFQHTKIVSLGIPEEKIVLKPNCVAATVMEKHRRNGFLFVGHLDACKGIEVLLQSWQEHAINYPLTVIGSGPFEKTLKARYGSDSNIRFLGQVPHHEVDRIMQASRFLIHPSLWYETFGLTIIEAMQNATPVIGFAIGPRNDFIRDGHNGFLTTSRKLAQTIEHAATFGGYVRMQRNARDFVRQFEQETVTDAQDRSLQRIAHMKVSIITVCYNAERTIGSTIQSVLEQDYPDIEHIIVDGASTDNTIGVIDRSRIATLISEPDKGIYDAMNKGIRAATGDIVGTLNADDFYASNNVISTVVDAFHAYHVDSVFADVYFVSSENLQKPIHHYSSREFHPDAFTHGHSRMPAHPTFFVRRSYFEKLGYYKTCYRIAGDYELLVRFLYNNGLSYHYIPAVLTIMRLGGVSTRWRNKWTVYREILQACKENGIRTSVNKWTASREILQVFKENGIRTSVMKICSRW